MIERALPTIWKERRRLTFVGLLAFFAGYFFYANSGIVIHGLNAGIWTGALYAAVIVPVSLVVCIVLPGMRFLIEAIAITRLLLAMLVFTYPAVGSVILGNPMLTAMIVVSSGAILSRSVLHGRMVRIKPKGLLARLKAFATRRPARILAPTPFQARFVNWMDDTQPIALQAR